MPNQTALDNSNISADDAERFKALFEHKLCTQCRVRDLSICSYLEGDEISQFSDILQHVDLPSGSPLFDEGEPSDFVFSITAGAVKLYKLLPDGRRQVTGFMFPGDFLGLARSSEYVYSAEAVENVNLCRLPRTKLETLIGKSSSLKQQFLSLARDELADAQDHMLLLGRKTAIEKLASFLIMLSKRSVRRGDPDNPIKIPMNRNDIGDFLGLTTETISRTLTRLRKGRVIEIGADHSIVVIDQQALTDLSEGL